MLDNPCQSANAASSAPKKTRATGWLVWSGVASLALGVVCAASTIIGMFVAVERIAHSTAAPKPSDLAQGISLALIPSVAVVPLAIVGIVLLVAGFAVRQPND